MLRTVAAGSALALVGCAVLVGLPASEANAQTLGQEVRDLDMTQLDEIGVPTAWQTSEGAGVTVGVLDTGVDGSVSDLSGVVTEGPDYTAGADPAGYQPPEMHATWMASIIAAHGDGPGDSEGMIGVAPEAKILSVRVILDDSEPGLSRFQSSSRWDNALGEGIHYAVNHGVKVINMSLGGNTIASERAAIDYAVSHGVVVVASAGNSGSGSGYTAYSYPASYPGVISVAALNSNGTRASFSDNNASVVISAPGVNVIAAGPADNYYQVEGTSPAAAFVSGVVALIRSKYPGLSPALVEQALVTSTTERPAGGYDTEIGFGEVNAPGALAAAAKLAATRPQSGIASTTRFTTGSLPAIQVTHRNKARIRDYGAAAAAAGVCFLIALILLIIWSARASRAGRADRDGPGDGQAWYPGLQEAAQPEQVLHAGLDLHLA